MVAPVRFDANMVGLDSKSMSQRDSRFDGNCGMFAMAVADVAYRAGKDAEFVLAHDAESPEHLRRGEFHLFHVAIEIDGVLCDARGRIATDAEVLSFMAPPIPPAKVERFPVNRDVKAIIRRKTRWTVSFEKYADAAERLVKELARTTP